jgi:hypothetical protein
VTNQRKNTKTYENEGQNHVNLADNLLRGRHTRTAHEYSVFCEHQNVISSSLGCVAHREAQSF